MRNNNTIKSFLEDCATISSRSSGGSNKRTLKLLPRDEEDRVEVVLVETEGCQDDDIITESVTETDGCGDTQDDQVEVEVEVEGLDSEALTKRSKSVIMSRDLMKVTSLGKSMKIGEYFKSSIDEYM